MDASERLAALLAGELNADERIALEAELARDPELRANLAAMERADEHLAALSSPVPSAGFDQRLDDAVAATLREVLGDEDAGSTEGSTAAGAHGDVFTARRRDRASRRTQALIGVAAAAVVLVGSGVLLTSFGEDDSAEDSASTMEAMDADDSGDAATDLDAEADGGATGGPIVVADDRTLDDADLDALLAGGELDVVRSQDLEEFVGREVAGTFQAELGAAPAQRGGEAAEDGQDDAETEESDEAVQDDEAAGQAPEASAAPELLTRDGVPLPADAAADVARCLDELLVTEPDAIPVYVELATYEDTEVVVLGLVTVDPETGTFARSEVWALERATCQVLRFSQA